MAIEAKDRRAETVDRGEEDPDSQGGLVHPRAVVRVVVEARAAARERRGVRTPGRGATSAMVRDRGAARAAAVRSAVVNARPGGPEVRAAAAARAATPMPASGGSRAGRRTR